VSTVWADTGCATECPKGKEQYVVRRCGVYVKVAHDVHQPITIVNKWDM